MQHPETREAEHPGPGKYIAIGIVLGVITVIEVGAFYMSITAWLLAMILLLLSASKFVLVVGYFMHLRFDDRRFLALFAVPFVIALSIMIALLGVFENLTR